MQVMLVNSVLNPQQHCLGEEKHYKQLLIDIEQQRSKDKSDVALLMKWLSCMHRLSVIYQSQSDFDAAYYYLITPHNWILGQLHEQTITKDELAIMMNALTITFKPLYHYTLTHPCCDDCKKNLEQQRVWLAQSRIQTH